MNKDFIKGIYLGIGFFLVVGVLLGITWAVGFHIADEIKSGTFSGDYIYNGDVNFSSANVIGLDAVPSGAVMAFNLSSCPQGWSELDSARGRTIVGLNPADTSFDTLLETGGEKMHTLTVSEMPSHSHTYSHRVPTSPASPGYSWHDNDWILVSTSGNTNSVGGSEAHNNLQPYIALLYCVKN